MLYLIKAYGKGGKELLKIGFTDNWDKRKGAYFTHTPDYELLGTREGDQFLETYFQRKFKKYKYKPRSEWFEYKDEIIDSFKNHFPIQEELQIVLRGLKSIPTREISIIVDGVTPLEVVEFAEKFNPISIFTDKMKVACDFLKNTKEKYINYIPEPYRTYIQTLGIPFIITSSYRKYNLDEAMVKRGLGRVFSQDDLDEIVTGYFQIGQRYSKAQIKQDLQEIYNKLGIVNKPKATDLDKWFELRRSILTVDKKKVEGYEIIKIKE